MTEETTDAFIRLAHEMVIESTDQAYQMMLGGMPKELETLPVPDGFQDKVYDFLGTIQATGERSIQLSLGLDEEPLKALCGIMMGAEMDDETILMGCQQELLNIILGGTIGALSQLASLKLQVPRMEKAAKHPFSPAKSFAQILSFTSDRVHLEFLLAVTHEKN
ncbi:MAG: chemotaxis protein CheX [Candidatus Omnitrophica bacterium]|nr:chemotaxis protein CheX [Candidatus Omnitrophota bacterium]MCA9431268.1 chemotaxis protein CheX [Candidatus Omnitrophota bacterium]MCA9434793.1 chemotaxis protein CheX [Candidatus Omnitrophota bacterium]MCA9442721.1 chemotaxis protein CheX [Candidatus Omnitrophota bacterium]